MRRSVRLGAAAALLLGGAASDPPFTVDVVLRDHRFSPAEIEVPANRRVEITIDNQDATADEFDSTALRVEKVIAGHDKGTVRLRPLDPGRYTFIGEFHSDTAQGVVIAK